MTGIMFILLLFVFGCVFASPTCTDEEANKCMSDGGNFDFLHLEETFPKDEAHLTEFCSNAFSLLDCAIGFIDRCPNTKYADYLEGMKGQKAVFKKLCDTSNSFRAEYLENVACLNNKISTVAEKCAEEMNIFADGFKCSIGVRNYKDCIEDAVKECGEKTVEIFRTLYHPRQSINTTLCEQILKNLRDMGIIS
ncbi:uncharacterized protein LOC129225110 [Uloborus diversus]|uniref:uncharacterized protein LOC129225110 n=1 Tax=Uloborus diversus TaxID=327109 RepID=UPI00240A2001|nr:uncharacterized protein LOC129225110 [Uloborus diversus]